MTRPDMKRHDKWLFPAHEEHLPEWMAAVNKVVDGRQTYQYHKYAAAMNLCPPDRRRLAVDVGAHVGLWSYYMARDFQQLAAFEPMPLHGDCWMINMDGIKNAVLQRVALGANKGKVRVETRTENSSGDTGIVPAGVGDINQCRLDDYRFTDLDFLKIDTEGYEYDVLRGGAETVMRCKPVIVVEQKGDMIEKYGHKKMAAVRFLEKMGARVALEISGDYVLAWD